MGVEKSATVVLLAGFSAWLAGERGLSPATVRCYGSQANIFMAWLADPVDVAVRQLDSGQVTAFMVDYCRDRNTWSAKAMATALRALLRFLHVCGQTSTLLAGAVPAVAGWRLASLPRGLDAAVVARLLASCDRTTIVGRRDYAILTMLARLGLRGAEVTGLQLDDIDWRNGEIVVHGKGNRLDRLPLPVDVGDAIVAYLTDGRPAGAGRAVFCTVRAPLRPLTAAALRQIMSHACRRAGLLRVGAHRLRRIIAGLARREQDRQRPPAPVHRDMDLRRQPAARPSKRFTVHRRDRPASTAPLFRAPAACWCARTTDESTLITHWTG